MPVLSIRAGFGTENIWETPGTFPLKSVLTGPKTILKAFKAPVSVDEMDFVKQC